MNALINLLATLGLGWLDNRREAERYKHTEAMAVSDIARTVEEAIGRGQGRFGRFIDAYTRLMRPLILTMSLTGIVWIVHLCYTNPVEAAAVLQAIQMAEDILLMLLVFPLAHFGIRPFEKGHVLGKMVNVATNMATARAIKSLKEDANRDARLAAEMADTTKPLSNWAIVEINRRMQAGEPIN